MLLMTTPRFRWKSKASDSALPAKTTSSKEPFIHGITAGFFLVLFSNDADLATCWAVIPVQLFPLAPFIKARSKLKSGSSGSAGTQPVTRPQRFPPFSRKNRANPLHINGKALMHGERNS
jgi:hypothetical protein